MTPQEFRALLDLMMCSDPWPVTDTGNGDGHDTLIQLVEREAKERGYRDWIGACHYHPKPEPVKP